uniref:Myomesin 2a n=1 Tax=Gadus morhua TaxID=8049 RepID=A0A8C5FV50_GADMO
GSEELNCTDRQHQTAEQKEMSRKLLLSVLGGHRPSLFLVGVQVRKKMVEKYVREEPMIRGPKFVVRLRSHTVFENSPIKLFCTVEGFPVPIVTWSVLAHFTIQYEIVFIQYTKINITFTEKFGPVFASEGGSASLTATMHLEPNLANLQPDSQWYRDDTRLVDSKWVKINTGRGTSTLTIPNLFKDDEGLYTLRLVTKGGTAEHSAFISVSDGPPPVVGAPGAPMDIRIHDANRDYVIVSWKPPNTTTEGPILGYFVDKCEVGTENWAQCNDHPIKICKYPVPGLFEGHSYYFRVRAVNARGISKPSRMSDPIAALDPTEFERLHGEKHTEEEEPTLLITEGRSMTYVVLSWKAPAYSSKAPMWYYIEKVGTAAWQRVNTQVPIRSPRYAVFDLAEGKEYQFRVLSANMYGTSEPSEPSKLIQTQALKGVPSAPGQVISTRETDTSLLIQWAPPKEPNNLIGYYIDQCVKGSKDWTSANHKPHSSTKFVVSGLTTGETYVFRVQAINELGLSDESQESSPLSVKAALTSPTAPYDVALLGCDGQSMVLNWKKPLHTGGTAINAYFVDKRRSGATMWREVHIPAVEGLTQGAIYQFRVYAANLAGLGKSSKASADFSCEAWTMPEPGPAYDLTASEVRDTSLVLEWKKPVYYGSGPITGYHVEYAKKGSSDWTRANETAVSHRYLKVEGLEEGAKYVFRVRGVNEAGVGMASLPSDSVVAKALAGAQEVSCSVDEKSGDIVFAFESCQMNVGSEFLWKKNYKEITEFSSSIVVHTEGNLCKLMFKNAVKEDFGTYSVSVSHTDGVSSSCSISAEELQKMLELSYSIRHPIIPLKSELAYKILERGRMRFWLQAEEISSKVTYKFFANNKELSGPNKMAHDVSTGVIEFILDHFTEDSEGTYTCQITDGGGKAQSSLVLIGDAFKAALAEADYQRREYIRVKEGKTHQTFSSTQVEMWRMCSILHSCLKVANLKKESEFHWYKEDTEIIPDVKPDLGSGVCKLPIHLFSRKTTGVYKATISDDRGKDMSQVDISGKVFDDVINKINQLAGASAAELVINCTATGIQLQCHMKYYTSEMNIHWMHGLTCTVCGDPKPLVSWLKNGNDVEPDNQYVVSLDQGKFACLTINGIGMDDSGKYTMIVQNKYGGECVDIVVSSLAAGVQLTTEAFRAHILHQMTRSFVSVYRHGDTIPVAKPNLTAKTIIPPKMPIELPQPKTAAPSPAPPASPSPAPPKAVGGRGMKSPTPTRRK